MLNRTPRDPRSLPEMVDQLRRHIRLLREYAQKAFGEGDADFFGEVAGKLRLLVTRSGSNKPLLIRCIEKTGADLKLTLDGPPIRMPTGPQPGDRVTLDQFMRLDAVGVRLPSGKFVMLNKTDMIKAWAEQTGASHEDWTMDETLRIILTGGIYIGGLPAAAAELKVTTNTVFQFSKEFLSGVDSGSIKVDGGK